MPSAALARLVVLEARRGGLPWLVAAALVLSFALAAFLSQVAVTESRELQLAIVASVLRASAAFLIAAQVTASVQRELNDKALELMLSLPLSRVAQYLGRLAGFGVCAAAVALIFAMPLLLWAPASAVMPWATSLAVECTLMAAVAFFFSSALTQFVPAMAATAGLYLLSRSMAAMQAMAAEPLYAPSLATDLARRAVDLVAFVLPPLDAVTRTEWLLYGGPSAAVYVAAILGLAAYCALIVAAGLFDFYRRNL